MNGDSSLIVPAAVVFSGYQAIRHRGTWGLPVAGSDSAAEVVDHDAFVQIRNRKRVPAGFLYSDVDSVSSAAPSEQ